MKQKHKVVQLPSKKDYGAIEYDPQDKRYSIEAKYYVHKDPRHLYIISEEEIQEGDWVIDYRTTPTLIHQFSTNFQHKEVKKIIASTNNMQEELSVKGDIGNMPQIPDSFIQKYVKQQGKIEEVEVEYEEHLDQTHSKHGAYVLTLKLSPDNTIFISLLKSKIYTREEVVKILHNSLDATTTNHRGMRRIFERQLNEWIEEHVK